MNKELEKLLFKTIERAIEYGADMNRYGEFDFSDLYKKIEGKSMAQPFEPYEKVWVFRNNKPEQMMVFAYIEAMDYAKTDIEGHYRLTEGTYGVGWGNNEGTRYSADKVFPSKKELLCSMS